MDAVEDIKQRLSIEDVFSEYVELKRAGRNFRALSPFSNEKTPSLMISPEKQIWHDFSSGKGGNMFSFVMEMEGLDFKGALEHLARKAGIDLSQYKRAGGGNSKLKERLYQAHELAAKFYQVQFSKNQVALEYVFKKRGFNKETALAFRIGYSPNNGSALSDFLKSKGFTSDELKRGGLAIERRGQMVDMFRGRLMVPLMDGQGKVIGFTARLLEDDPSAPKYFNTPATLLYDKSRHVFGLHVAKDAIRSSGYAVVVEGNLDVMASYQAGVRQVVATAGTAATELHFKALSRFASDVRLAFDQDKAGLNATERSIPLAAKAGVSLSIITIPSGKDPDELIKKDPKIWEEAVQKPVYALDWLMAHYAKQLDINSATGKRQFSDIMLKVVRGIPDSVEQDHYLSKLAEVLGVSHDALASKMYSTTPTKTVLKKPHITPEKLDKQLVDNTKTQNQLLAITLMRPTLRAYLQPINSEMLFSDEAKDLLTFLQKNPEYLGKPEDLAQGLHASGVQGADEKRTEPYTKYGEGASETATPQSAASTSGVSGSAGQQAGGVQTLGEYVKILILLFEELYQHLEVLELQYEAARLQVRLIEHYVKAKKADIAAQLRGNSAEAEQQKLLKEAKKLDELLNLTKVEQANGQ